MMQDQNTATDPARDPAAIKKAQAQVAELKKMFADSAEARAQRQAAKPLYERLGGREALRAVVTDIIELHFTEPLTKPLALLPDTGERYLSTVLFEGMVTGTDTV